MPPKVRPAVISGSSTSGSSSSSSSSTSSTDSDSSSDSESSQASQKSGRSHSSSGPDKKKKNAAKKAHARTRSKSASSISEGGNISDSNFSPVKKKASSASAAKKHTAAAPTSKVVPKKSATAKPVAKAGPKSKKAVTDTESEMDDDSMLYSMTKLAAKEADSKKAPKKKDEKPPKVEPAKKEHKSAKTAQPPPPPAPSLPRNSTPKQAAISSAKKPAAKDTTTKKKNVDLKSIFSDESNRSLDTDDTDTSLIRDLPVNKVSGKHKAQPPPPPPPSRKQEPAKKQPPPAKHRLPDRMKTRHSSVESDGNSSLNSIESLISDHSSRESSRDRSLAKKEKGDKKAVKKPAATSSPKKSSRPSKKSSQGSDSESEASTKVERPTTRKQTRGSAVKKSVHVTGRRESSESESEAEEGGGGSPHKRQGRPPVPKNTKPRPQYPPIEKRACPVQGCNSKGHLSGKLDRHFTHDACPIFHNLTAELCRERMKEYQRKEAARSKALAQFSSRSPLLSPSHDQKRYQEKVREERKVKEEIMSQDEEEEVNTERERSLQGMASEYDLALFREAQAQACQALEEQLKGLPDVKGTKYVEMGRYEMEVWYQSPYPEEYTILPKIYICEFCLKYMKSYSVMKRHGAKCVWRHPPGDEIYRKDKLSVFEVCGKKYKQYCQNLCLIAKSFLDHKTLYYDVEPFLFYVMTVADSEGCHIVGYFSKEKNSFLNYNVSCILTLPPYQRQGYGRLLIDFSYLLSKMEGKIGSPEKPLSDLGLISYRAYWKDILLEYLTKDSWVVADKEISVKSISEEMGIQSYDIISTLQFLGMIKYWRGKHIILKKEDVINDYLERTRRRPRDKEISAAHLKWKPYEPTAKEKRQAEQIKKKQEERQKGR